MVVRVLLVVGVLCASSVALAQEAGGPDQISTREARPLAVSLVGGLSGVGVEASLQLSDRFGVAAHVSTLLLITEVAIQSRFFFRPEPSSGVYVSGGLHLLGALVHGAFGESDQTPVFASATFGWESRSRTGFLLSLEAGGMIEAGEVLTGGSDPVFLPLIYLRVGRAF